MEQYSYATRPLEEALGLRFKPVKATGLKLLSERLQTIADRIGADVPVIEPPYKGFLRHELEKKQRTLLNQALIQDYAEQNVKQQKSLLDVPIAENSEPIQSLIAATRDRVEVSFSNRPIHEACGASAGKRRLFYLRRSVADKVVTVCQALNEAGLMAHVEDCWRHPEVQEGLYIRRIIQLARDYEGDGWGWQQVKKVAMSFTASIPGLAGHMAGAAIDLRLRRRTGDKDFLPLGNDYPDGEALSSLHFPYLTRLQWETRVLFAATMRMAGFKLLPTENWHASHGDRGLSVDFAVHMRRAMYGPLEGFDKDNGVIQPYAATNIDTCFLTDRETEDLVDDAREHEPDGKEYRYTVVELAERLRAARRGEAVE